MTRDESALMQLCIAFVERIDGGRAESVADLFTPDGVLISAGERVAGEAALRERFARRQREAGLVTRHLLTNASFTLQGDAQATGRSLMTVFRRQGEDAAMQPPRVADVDDVYVRDASGRWRFAQRRIERVFGP